MDDHRARLSGWASLMQRMGLDVPRQIQTALLPRSGPGTFGGYAAGPPQSPPPRQPVSPFGQRPRAATNAVDLFRTRPQQPLRPVEPQSEQPSRPGPSRVFPRRNAPWGDG